MTVVTTLGRGAASGLAGALVWLAVSVLAFGTPEPVRAAVAGVALGALVALVTALARLR
ncbi:hypothetical protein [Haloplanus sp. C73]|uniref:hypothetical protein n=1 Tax=Haloplanus sp. C73 TaxID=3421641 RepID=UPI003EBB8B52